ncbi:MAG: LacI family DNA-binding transcriptional regulator [Eubacteriales bacterium]|nr:LacI family DNA-binding transcriptional regulator [Eubacteriales bacterium]
MKVSIKKISEITGFSPATVSNALNYKKGVNKDTAAKIFQVAQELGYLEENRITKVKLAKYKKNGLIVDDTPFFPLLIDGVEQECRENGLEMTVCTLDSRDENYEEQVRWLLNDKASAVILLGTELMEEDLDIYRGAACPLLLLDNWSADMSFNGVLINNSDSARMATEYLVGKGHKRIGYLRGNFRIKAFRSRAVGYQVALNKAGLAAEKKYTVTLPTTMDGAYQGMKEYLEKKPELPTAFFADDDMIALGAMKALTEAGYRIPDDVSLIGFDDLSFSSISSPGLTTLRVSKRDMGKAAVRRLRELIQGEDSRLKIQICTQFVERGSVKDLSESSRG